MSWTQIINTATPAAASYSGKAKLVKFTFSAYPEQLDFVNDWLVENFLNNLKEEAAANNGSQVLKLRLWRDTSPTWQTDYKGELELTTPEGFETPFLVAAIIVVALSAIAYYFIIEPLINSVTNLIYGTSGSSIVPWGAIAIIAVAAVFLVPQLTGGKSGK
jgi:hypothetical protein